jgi:hypothetical protein
MNINSIKWTYNEWTIDQFQREAATIDCDPEWQRGNVDTLFHSDGKPSKAQSIIASILSGLDIGEIKLATYKGKRASVDGGNRKRAILAFLNNKFKLHKKSPWGQKAFGDLTEEERETVRNYKMRVIIYDNIPARTIGNLFRTTNTVTPVNKQEMRNSYGEDPLAVLVRRTVRVIPEISNVTHPLYEISGGTDEDPYYRWLGFNNARLRMEDQLARILYLVINGEKVRPAPDNELNHMYDTVGPMWEKNPLEQAKIEKKLKAALDFFHKVAVAAKSKRPNGLSIRQFSMLVRLYFYMTETYQSFKVDNYATLWASFAKAFVAIEKRRDLVALPGGYDADRTVGEAFGGYLSFDRPEDWKIRASIDWFLEEFDPLNFITVKDPKRCYTAKQIEDRLIEQDWTDYIDGKPLKLEDAVGAHKIAHTNGGKTTLDNLVVISAAHNSAMGSTDVETYKSWYERDNRKRAS